MTLDRMVVSLVGLWPVKSDRLHSNSWTLHPRGPELASSKQNSLNCICWSRRLAPCFDLVLCY